MFEEAQIMNSTGQNIVARENLPKNIERLAAQREIYYRAKQLFGLQLFLTIIVTLFLTIVGLVFSYFGLNIDWLRGIYGVLITFADLFLINTLNKLRQKAAAIQESFDCDVLNLEWNKVIVGDEPLIEDVKKYSAKHLSRVKSFDELKNWYAETIAAVDGTAAKIICQRSNFSYDYAIRSNFLFAIAGGALTILILLISFALFENLTLRSFFLTVILPFMPVLTLSAKLYNDHNSSIKNLESLKSNLNTLWSSVLSGAAANSDATIRQIQDKIFLNRKSNPLIPELIYNRLRPKLEAEMYYGVDELVEKYVAVKKRI